MPVHCPFCHTAFDAPDSWCPHFIGTHDDLTLDDYKDFISGDFPAQTVTDENDLLFYFMERNVDDSD
jgi:hypothetical protein